MTALQAILLGVLQGLTEFLPVSSSGHLVLAEHLLGFDAGDDLLAFDIFLHLATLLALLTCLWRTWLRIALAPFTHDKAHLRLLGLLLIGTVPGAVAGFFLEDAIATYTRSPSVVAVLLLGTALILILGERLRGVGAVSGLTVPRALLIGLAQACALPPGLSRSGLTISAGRAVGLSRSAALDFSFLLAVPIIAGASIVAGYDVFTGAAALPPMPALIAGMLASFAASVAAILWLRSFVAKRSLAWFAFYLIPVAAFTLVWNS